MRPPSTHNKTSLNRRNFLNNTLRLVVLGSILPLQEACKNKPSKEQASSDPKSPETPVNNPFTSTKTKRIRKKWNRESLVVNTKTRTVHFPTSKVYKYYDEIKPKHLQVISVASWATALKEPVKWNKEQSGNILEILSLQHLRKGINDKSLKEATSTLAKAFTPACSNKKGVNQNMMNFRLHELMLQLLTLNTAIPDRWRVFNSLVKKPPRLRRRQKWMENEVNFNQRVSYILKRQNDYITRLTKRAGKYSFT